MKQSVTLSKYWHTIFSQLFSFILRYKLYLSEYSSSRLFFFTCFMCIWSFGRTKTQKCPLLVSFRARRGHTRTHARTHTHTHTYTGNSVSRADCTLKVLLSNMSSNLATVKTAFYNNRRTIDLILTLSFGQGGTNARRCEGKEVVLEKNAAIILRSQKKTLNKRSLI